jgi:hypothetical protein
MVELCSVEDCGEPVFVAVRGLCRVHYDRWWRFGDPAAKLTRHPQGTPVAVRFWSFVDKRGPDECWQWNGTCDAGGYGQLKVNGKNVRAHRLSYALNVGPVVDAMDLDHLCHTRDLLCPGGKACPHRSCVNPSHLEPTTGRENRLRGRSFAAFNAAKTHCVNGHPFDEANTYFGPRGGRGCRTCQRAAQSRYQQRKALREVAT